MSEGIRNQNKFAGLEGLHIVMDTISGERPSSISQIKSYCSTQSLELALSFDSTMALLSYIGLIELDHDKGLVRKISPTDSKDMTKQLLELLIAKMIDDKSILDLFHPLGVKYDVVSDRIAIRNSSISLSMSGVKKLLISIGFLDKPSLSDNLLTLNQGYADFFREIILPAILPEKTGKDETMSLDELKSIMERKRLYGMMAEEFVLKYEKTRLASHPMIERVKIISDVDCGAGYDIISFNILASPEIDRFIEVKSYSGNAQFYWSKNEIEEAQARGDAYFLYLVDRDKIPDKGYVPNIIQAPFRNVFLNEAVWGREAQSWRFYMNS